MHVLHIISVNGIGGAEKQMLTLVPALQRAGVQVSCLLVYRQQFAPECHSIREALHRLGVGVAMRKYSRIFDRGMMKFLQQHIERHAPTLIHAHLRHVEFWMAWLRWRKKMPVPVVSTIHGYNDRYHSTYGMEAGYVKGLSPYLQLTRFIGRQLDGFIAISKGIAKLYVDAGIYPAEKITVVHHGTESSMTSEPSGSDRQGLVVIGRLVGFKGHRYAIEALRLLREKRHDLKLHIYGKGSEEEALRLFAAERGVEEAVLFHGFAVNIHEALSRHRVALVPSIGEPFGIVFFDCFKAGIPVVAFDVPASNEIIEDGVSGLLADPRSAASLAEKTELLLTDPDLSGALTRNARLALVDKFSVEKMAVSYVRLYEKYAPVQALAGR